MTSKRGKRESERNSADNKNDNHRGSRGNDHRRQNERSQYIEHVVIINRVPKVIKGSHRFSFTTLVIVGDGGGMVDIGHDKAKEALAAIQKDAEEARKNFSCVPIIAGTITHPVQGETTAGIILLRPAASGTGLTTGGAVRPVLEYAGVQDVLSEPLDTNDSVSVVYVTVDVLKQPARPEEVAAYRSKSLEKVTPVRVLRARTGQGA